MEPFYFDSGDERLLGVYHPSADALSRKAVVICPPVYSEYFRTYRAIGKVAMGWAKKGYHVLRFDYTGTGDSSGSWIDGGPNRWLQDIETATNEVMEISGSDEVTIAGVRLGASLGAIAATRIDAMKSIIMWDPIWSGADYLKSLQTTHDKLLRALRDMSGSEKQHVNETELAGFVRADWVQSELVKIDLMSVELASLGNANLVFSNQALKSDTFIERCESQGVDVNTQIILAECDWATHSESSLQAPNIILGLNSCL